MLPRSSPASLPLTRSASSLPSKAALKPHPHPIRAFSAAKKECADSSKAYGECMLRGYQDVEKGMCAKEFEGFKACVQNVMGRKW